MSHAPVWLILAPLAAAIASLLAPGGRRGWLVWPTIGATLAAGAALAVAVASDGPIRYHVGGWAAPLGIDLYADGLSTFMLLTTTVVTAAVSVFALHFVASRAGASAHVRRIFWPLWFFLWAGLNAIFLAADAFNIFVVFETIGLAGIALITLSRTPQALTAAMRYLLAAFLGSLSFLMGVALLYAEHHTLDLVLLGQAIADSGPSRLAFALMMVGMMLKTALFPLHFWLPDAHSGAPAPVSAMLSALVVKASFFVLLRLWFVVFYEAPHQSTGWILGLLGATAIIWSSYQAIQQGRLKLIFAHSTVAQVGYLFLIFPLTATGAAAASDLPWFSTVWTGASFHVLAHALAKASLFISAGVISYHFGTDDLRALRQLSSRLPLTTFAIAMSGISLIGLPPSGGFVAKWLLMKAVVESGQWWWLPPMVVGGLLTAVYVFLILRYAFSEAAGPEQQRPRARGMELTALFLALLAVLIGFRIEEPLNLLAIGQP
jgi:multicomponent Na+:H+ antiporter subunit D